MSKKFEELQTFGTVKEYRQSPELNYSVLKEMQFNPSVILGTEEIKDSDPMRLGSMVDTILTEPDRFDEQFHVMAGTRPSDTVQDIIQDLISVESPIDDKELVLDMCEQHKYRSNWGRDKLYDYILAEGTQFYEELLIGKEKRLVEASARDLANQIAQLLATHEWTAAYFGTGYKDIEVIFQFKFYSKLEGVDCKCMIDILLVDHFAQTLQPLDLKVGEQSFYASLFQFKWYLQGAMYRECLEMFKDNSSFEDYKVEPFKFIHVNTKQLNYPVIYEMSEEFHEHALLGWKESGREFLGIYELIEDFKWYEEYRMKTGAQVLIPRKLIENKGVIKLLPPRSDDLPF